MFCGNCGKELKEGAKFCAYCGTPVNRAGIRESHPDKKKKKAAVCTVVAVVVVIAIAFVLKSCVGGSDENRLVGTWELQTYNGSTSWWGVGAQISLAKDGTVYDPDEVLMPFSGNNYNFVSWYIMADGQLLLHGPLDGEDVVNYTVSAKKLELSDGYRDLVFSKVG